MSYIPKGTVTMCPKRRKITEILLQTRLEKKKGERYFLSTNMTDSVRKTTPSYSVYLFESIVRGVNAFFCYGKYTATVYILGTRTLLTPESHSLPVMGAIEGYIAPH